MKTPPGRTFRDAEIDPIAMRFARTIEEDRERGIARLVVRMAWTLVRADPRRKGRFSALAPEVFAMAIVEAASLSQRDGNELGPTSDFDAALMRVLSRFYAWLGERGDIDRAHAMVLADRALRIALGILTSPARGTKRVA